MTRSSCGAAWHCITGQRFDTWYATAGVASTRRRRATLPKHVHQYRYTVCLALPPSARLWYTTTRRKTALLWFLLHAHPTTPPRTTHATYLLLTTLYPMTSTLPHPPLPISSHHSLLEGRDTSPASCTELPVCSCPSGSTTTGLNINSPAACCIADNCK